MGARASSPLASASCRRSPERISMRLRVFANTVKTPARCRLWRAGSPPSRKKMKRYLITGASRGIGRAIAMKLASPDVTLLLHGRDTVALAETCRAVEKSAGKTAELIHDLANFRGIENLLAEVGHKPIDLLVN